MDSVAIGGGRHHDWVTSDRRMGVGVPGRRSSGLERSGEPCYSALRARRTGPSSDVKERGTAVIAWGVVIGVIENFE